MNVIFVNSQKGAETNKKQPNYRLSSQGSMIIYTAKDSRADLESQPQHKKLFGQPLKTYGRPWVK